MNTSDLNTDIRLHATHSPDISMPDISTADTSSTDSSITAIHTTGISASEQLIVNLGLRATAPRRAVLSLLWEAAHALTHQELLNQLASRQSCTKHSHDAPFDRVTLYRVLDWLVANGIIHKVTGQDRAWRFQINRSSTVHRHAHFQCSRCNKTYCLDEVHPHKPASLPAHFTVESIELNIKGVCASCETFSLS